MIFVGFAKVFLQFMLQAIRHTWTNLLLSHRNSRCSNRFMWSAPRYFSILERTGFRLGKFTIFAMSSKTFFSPSPTDSEISSSQWGKQCVEILSGFTDGAPSVHCQNNPSRRDILFPDMRMKYGINLSPCSYQAVLWNLVKSYVIMKWSIVNLVKPYVMVKWSIVNLVKSYVIVKWSIVNLVKPYVMVKWSIVNLVKSYVIVKWSIVNLVKSYVIWSEA